MKIGIVHKGYPEVRNIITPWKFANFKVIKIIDIYKVCDFIYFKILKRTNPKFHNKLYTLRLGKVDGVHLFNGVWLNASKPWIVTFESVLPRMAESKKEEEYLIKKLTNKKCKAIVAMSKCNFETQKKFIKETYPAYSSILLSKLKQLYPPQVIPKKISLNNTDKLKLLFVGTDFYRKGGHVALRAFMACFCNNNKVELTIVSTLKAGYISDFSLVNDTWVRSKLEEQSNVVWIKGSENNQVLDLMKTSDVILLPTFADTFGYTAIEGMAYGCIPVVSNIRALPEIVNDSNGYILNATINKQGNLDKSIATQVQSDKMINQLILVFNDIWSKWNSNKLKETKILAQKWVSDNCNPLEYTTRLQNWMFND